MRRERREGYYLSVKEGTLRINKRGNRASIFASRETGLGKESEERTIAES